MKTETIQALLDGKTVQFNANKDPMNHWVDLDVRNREQYYLFASLFTDNDTYPLFRIKPKAKTVKVKIALMKNGELFYTEAINDPKEEYNLVTYSNYFDRWLTDWETYEIIPK